MCFWATVCKTVLSVLSDRCLSVCPVCDVGVLWSNGWMDQNETWHGGRPRPRSHCARWGVGPSSPPRKGDTIPQFSAHVGLLWTNGWMDQNTTWYEGKRRLWRHCVIWGPSTPQRGTTPTPIFDPCLLYSQTVAHLSYC